MQDTNERPVCHRAEDLVTYLYEEAGDADTLDFREHLKACEACRSEFAMFNQVHDSIVTWRNEVLGASFNSAPLITAKPTPAPAFVPREPKLSALAAIRNFFKVSPLWLRGAAAFAALLLCVLAIMVISRWSQQPVQVATSNPELKYSQQDLDSAVQKGIEAKLAELKNQQTSNAGSQAVDPKEQPRTEPAVYRAPSKRSRPKGLTLQERQQLAADLRLLPDEDELPFSVSSEEPNQ